MNTNDIIAVVDIGTSKLTCILVRLTSERRMMPVGYAELASVGVKNGVVADPESVSAALGAVVDAAERTSPERVTVRGVTVSVSGGVLVRPVDVSLKVDHGKVTRAHLTALEQRAMEIGYQQDYAVIHAIPMQYLIDDDIAITPEGMFGRTLALRLQTIHMRRTRLQNLALVMARSHLSIANVVYAPYASALACLTLEQKQLGVILIDMGAGVTSFAVFREGMLVQTGSVPVGGEMVTSDLARGLSLSQTAAERIKVREGHVLEAIDYERSMTIPNSSGEGTRTVRRSMVMNIIRARVEETLELVRDAIAKTMPPLDQSIQWRGQHVVLTGGASQLNGMVELVQAVFAGSTVSLASEANLDTITWNATSPFAHGDGVKAPLRPVPPPSPSANSESGATDTKTTPMPTLPVHPTMITGPTWSTALGLLVYAADDAGGATTKQTSTPSSSHRWLHKARRWIADNF